MLKSCCKNLTNILLSDIIDITFFVLHNENSVYLKIPLKHFSAVTLPLLYSKVAKHNPFKDE